MKAVLLRRLKFPLLRLALVWVVVFLGLSLSPAAAQVDTNGTNGTNDDDAPGEVLPRVVHIRLDSIIHPVAAEFVIESLREADKREADLFVMELSTPGGLLTSTREIFTAMLGAATPVVVYVSPSGAQAASAGFFILTAADVAAMAPGTNTGAAHPVAGSGQEIEGVMGEKVEQDSAATIRSLAARNGRNEELAEEAVVNSRSFTAQEALEGGLIDLIAPNLNSLLEELDGFELQGDGQEGRVLRSSHASVETLEMSVFQKFLAAIAHPNVAYILMALGGLGLFTEIKSPGAIFPGVIGAICLILAFFALSVLPVNYAGIALIALALLFFLAEIKVTSYGLLTVGGIVSLVLGSLMLFKTADPALRVSLDVIASVAGFSLIVVGFLAWIAVKVHRSSVTTGRDGLLQEAGVARTDLVPDGKVFIHGEIWNALADEKIPAGDAVRVVQVNGMTLHVRALRES